MAFATDGKAGVAINEKHTSPEFALGTATVASENSMYVYVVAGGTIAEDADATIDANFSATDGAGTGTYTVEVAGGVVSGDNFWLLSNTAAA